MTLESETPAETAPSRLEALCAYRIVGSAAEAAYDDLARLAAQVCATPEAFITFVDDQRQWFKSSIGAQLREAPLEAGFCTLVAASGEALVIPDTHADPRFASVPAAMGAAPVRFYAGVPLVAPGGQVLGALCVVDRAPRQASPQDLTTLEALARQVVAQLELRRSVFELSAKAEEERQSNRRMTLISAVAARCLLDSAPEREAPIFARELAAHLDAEVFFHYLLQPDGESLALAAHGGLSEEVAASRARLDLGQDLCAQSARERQPVRIFDADRSEAPGAQLLRSLGLRAYACHPLMAQGHLIGTLSFASVSRTEFTAAELGLMRTVADLLAIAMRRQRAEEELREFARRKDEFLAILAHELRNPLAPISNALHLLRLTDDDAAARLRAREVMERQMRQLVRLIDDLLDISRITQGKMELRKKPIELAAALRDAIEASAPLIDAAGHELTVELPPHALLLDGDPARLAQVFSNLLNNSAKHTEPGGRIHVRASRELDIARIVISDTGIGIPPDALSSIFDPFAQVESSIDRGQGGLGIGLTLVKRLVELHGGAVEARSEGLGKGSEFEVRLPALLGSG